MSASTASIRASTLASAAAAPLVRCDDPTREDCTVRVEPLPDDIQAELVQAAERGRSGLVKVTSCCQCGYFAGLTMQLSRIWAAD
jgi:hypothetical protein